MGNMDIRPNWQNVLQRIGEGLTDQQLHAALNKECRTWLDALRHEYGDEYRIHETDNFYLLTSESDRYASVLLSFLERTLKRILTTLDGIASDEGYGKHVVVVFANQDQYYDYVQHFYPDEGEYGLSAGMYLDEGYGHLVFPVMDINLIESTVVHELTHACLTHLPLPIWLNEGLAVVMEDVLANKRLYLNDEVYAEHLKYWNAETIELFWSGESFYGSDEGQSLSYTLAHVLMRNMSADYAALRQFCTHASFEDAGEAACQEYLGCSLSQLVGAFLGEGDWSPRPQNNRQ